jgi:hypothetical protein
MVQSLDSSVALVTHKALRALVPSDPLDESWAVLRKIVDHIWQSSEVSHVVSIYAAFGIVGVLLPWAPAGLVVKHEESVGLKLLLKKLQVLVEQGIVQEDARNEIVFDTYTKKK